MTVAARLGGAEAPGGNRRDALQQLRSTRGHLDAVIRMVEDGRYCVDVLHQVRAVESGLAHAGRAILSGHL
ncbi:protein containing DUF156, partial [mine drainage metagenome]